jgi:prepilin-type N-terminal cleavage/methylation domain-containing protein
MHRDFSFPSAFSKCLLFLRKVVTLVRQCPVDNRDVVLKGVTMIAKLLSKRNHAVTLVEMLIAVGIIAILATIVIGIATRIQNQAKEQLAKSTIAILSANPTFKNI